MRLHVGTTNLVGDIAAYAKRFDLLELSAERGKLPKSARLHELARGVPDGFEWSLVLPRAASALEPGPELEQELGFALDAARVLNARWLLLRTEPSVMPSARTRRRIGKVIELLPRAERRIAWEPRGLWEAEDAEAFARELDVTLVRDVAREEAPEGPTLYTRLRALGKSGVSLDAIERVFETLVDFEDSYVVIEGQGAARAAKTLRELMGEASAEEAPDDEDETDSELEHSEEA